MEINPQKIKKILCIKPRGIGDIVLSTIILENLSYYFQEASIDYLTEGFARQALVNNPMVNNIMIMGKTEFPLKVALRIRKEKYDLVLDLWSNPRSAQITFLSGIKYRAGFAYRGRKYAYNILATSSRGNSHSAEHNLEIIKALKIPVVSKDIKYYISAEDRNNADQFFEQNRLSGKKVLGIIPAGGWESKRCDKEKWVDIINAYKENYDLHFLILWGPGDEKDSEYIKEKISSVILAPPSDINKLAALIQKCNLCIANDSGPMHISAALGVPTIGLFGPTDPVGHGPYSPKGKYIRKEDLFCINCNKLVCPYDHECMKQLSVEALTRLSGDFLI